MNSIRRNKNYQVERRDAVKEKKECEEKNQKLVCYQYSLTSNIIYDRNRANRNETAFNQEKESKQNLIEKNNQEKEKENGSNK